MPKMTPLRAIRAHCIDCSGYSKPEVRKCVCPDCPLYQYRMGKNPAMAGRVGNTAGLARFRELAQESRPGSQPEGSDT
jgi:hypothetical protein